MATPIGAPPNAIALGALASQGHSISFTTWMALAVPLVLLSLFIGWRLLLLWLTESLHGISSGVTAFLPIVLLPARGVLEKIDIRNLSWEVLWLVAGGISLGLSLNDTGLAAWLIALVNWQALGAIGVLLGFVAVSIVLANFLSHTVTTSLLVPIVISLGTAGVFGSTSSLLAVARDLLATAHRAGHRLALIVCDHLMPGTSGTDFLIELHRDEATRPAHKILLTAQAGHDDTIRAINRAELNHYLTKPWDPADLQAVVRRQLTDYVLAQNVPPLLARLTLAPAATTLPPADELARTLFKSAQLLHTQGLAAHQVTHLVAGLKSYTRPTAAGPGRLDLAAGLTGVLTLLGHPLKPHQVTTDLAPGLFVEATPGDLFQIWTNLLQNALDALGPTPNRLEITARPVGAHEVAVSIIDHGPGVPADLRDRIFDLNFTTKTGAENFGLGIGLTLTQGLITPWGGHLTLTETPGGGATFTVTLPAA
jgi:signal transduction histidine kinase